MSKIKLTLLVLYSLGLFHTLNIIEEQKHMDKLIGKYENYVKKCMPVATKNGIQFCSGFYLSKEEIKLFNIDNCKLQITSKGYIIKEDYGILAVKKGKIVLGTTNINNKTVTLKENSLMVCFHEMLHVYQDTIGNHREMLKVRKDMGNKRAKQYLNHLHNMIEREVYYSMYLMAKRGWLLNEDIDNDLIQIANYTERD